MRVLVARGRRINLLLVRERGKGLLSYECLRDGAATIWAKARPGLVVIPQNMP